MLTALLELAGSGASWKLALPRMGAPKRVAYRQGKSNDGTPDGVRSYRQLLRYTRAVPVTGTTSTRQTWFGPVSVIW